MPRPHTRRLARAVSALLCAIGLAAGAAAGHGAPATVLPPGLTIALQDDHLPVVAEGGIEARLGLLASTGVRVTRVDVLWNVVAPTRPAAAADPGDPAYRWSRYDAIVDGLTARGIAVILNVYRSPAWANGGRGYQWAPSVGHFGRFMTALARRYDGRTADRQGRPHGPVQMFEPWNEPNLAGFLMPQWRRNADGTMTPASPRIYAGLLARAHAAIKAVQPDAWVIGVSGGPNGSDRPPTGSVGIVTFVRGLVALRPPADAFAQHLYPAVGPRASPAMPSYNRLGELIGELDAVRPGLPILITELGWTTVETSTRPSHVSEEEQEAYLREAMDMLAAQPRVRLAVWFNLAKFRPPGAPPPPLAGPPAPPGAGTATPAPPGVLPITPPAPPALTLSVTAPRRLARGARARFVVRLSRPTAAPILLQRLIGRRFVTLARGRSSARTVVIRARLGALGVQRFRARGGEGGAARRSATVSVLVVRAGRL